jgi:hypothetical protein
MDIEKIIADLKQTWPILDILTFDDLTIQDKLQKNSFHIINFGEQYLKEKNRLNKLNQLREKVAGECYHKYKTDNLELTKYEIEKYYLPKEPDIIKIDNEIYKQKIIVEFFEIAIDALKKQQWNIKLFMEDRKFGA